MIFQEYQEYFVHLTLKDSGLLPNKMTRRGGGNLGPPFILAHSNVKQTDFSVKHATLTQLTEEADFRVLIFCKQKHIL